MASNALVRLTNNTNRDLVFEVDINKPVKFVSKMILSPNTPSEVEVETAIPMVLFSQGFQNAIARNQVTLAFNFTTSNGVASTSGRYLANIQRFLARTATGWQIS